MSHRAGDFAGSAADALLSIALNKGAELFGFQASCSITGLPVRCKSGYSSFSEEVTAQISCGIHPFYAAASTHINRNTVQIAAALHCSSIGSMYSSLLLPLIHHQQTANAIIPVILMGS